MSVGGWLSNTNFLGGWPSAFYIFGSLGVIWGIPWFLIAHDLPEQHPRISPSELQYILENRYYVKRDKVKDALICTEFDVLFYIINSGFLKERCLSISYLPYR